MRFNPPPNWPQPPAGWTPPPGWEPDPTWGPAPEGWQFWVSDAQPTGQYAAPAGQYRPTKPSGSKTGVVVGAAALVVLLLIGVGVGSYFLLRGDHSSPTATSAHPRGTTTEATPTPGPSTTAPTTAAPTTTAPTTAAPDCARASSGGTKSNPATLGRPAKLGDYCVAVTKVVKDATGAVLAADSSNKPPTKGQYVLITLGATYAGKAEGDTYLDTFITLVGGDGQQYDDTSCDATTADDLLQADKLRPGQSLTATVCADVPAAALNNAVIMVKNYGSKDSAYWKIG